MKKLKIYISLALIFISAIFCLNFSIAKTKTVQAEDLNNYAVEESQVEVVGDDANTYLNGYDYLDTLSVPAYYDVRENYYLTYEDQSSLGLCWDFACLKSLENFIYVNFKEYYNFSEAWISLAYKKYDNAFNFGSAGSYIYVNRAINNHGVMLESDMPYEVAFNIGESNYTQYFDLYQSVANKFLISNIKYESYNINLASNKEVAINFFKKYIYEYGAIPSSICATTSTGAKNFVQNTNNTYYVAKADDIIDHNILITGWDDNYTCVYDGAQTSGAWICQSSWGKNSPYKYFYVPYCDVPIGKQIVVLKQLTFNGYTFNFNQSSLQNYTNYNNSVGVYLDNSASENNSNYSVDNESVNSTLTKDLFWYDENFKPQLTYKSNYSVSKIFYNQEDITYQFDITKNNQTLTISAKNSLDFGTYKVLFSNNSIHTFNVYSGLEISKVYNGTKFGEDNITLYTAFNINETGNKHLTAYIGDSVSIFIIFLRHNHLITSYTYNGTTKPFSSTQIQLTIKQTEAKLEEKELILRTTKGEFTFYIKLYYLGSTNNCVPAYINYITNGGRIESENYIAINSSTQTDSTSIFNEYALPKAKKYNLSFESANKIALEYNKTMIVEELKNRIITNDNREGLIPDIPFEYIQKSYGQEVAQEICDRINEEIKKENERRQGRGGR